MKDFLFVKSLILIRVMRVINELRRRSIHYYSSDSEKIKVPQKTNQMTLFSLVRRAFATSVIEDESSDRKL